MADILERLRNALRDTYAVDRQIGEGGMATVFLAEDLKHHRRVAIKVLRPELSATLGADRFVREIELAAQLQHPHIVPVYDSGSADGLLYYVMPFVEGESLRDLLQREHQLTLERAAEITRDAASGLSYAHTHGVVHRDVKPENIMISGGHAVVADFGIARAIDASRAANAGMTGAGMAIGTPAYMSPEQATADQVDARSDQYALACVYYEMVTGKQPFSAPTMQGLLTQVLTGPRPRLTSVMRDAPPELDGTLQRALAQDPAQRFPDIMAFTRAVSDASSGTVAATRATRRWQRIAVVVPLLVILIAAAWVIMSRPSRIVVSGAETIAVVPFSTSGAGAENLGEGMVDLFSNGLDGVGGIRTIESRQVLRAWQRQTRGAASPTLDDAIAVARSVKAASVLTGSVLATGARSRLIAELYDLQGKRLARAQVDGPTDSVLALADGLTLSILHEIWRSKEPLPSARSSAITSRSMDAIRAYLEGEKWYRRGEWDSARVALERAVQADSTFALAWYKLATTLGWKGQTSGGEAGAAGRNAVKYDSVLPPRMRTIVVAYEMFQRGRPAAVDSMRAYTASYPDDPDGWDLLGEAQYHTRSYHPYTPAELVAPFDRVLALDSTLASAAIHPMEVALTERDSTLVHRYMRVFQAAHDEEEARGASAAWSLIRGADTGFEAMGHASTNGMRIAAVAAMMSSPNVTGNRVDSILRAFMAQLPNEQRAQGLLAIGTLDGGLGRQQESRRVAAQLAAVPGMSLGEAQYVTLMPVLGAFADSSMIALFRANLDKVPNTPATAPFVGYYRALAALDQGETAKAAALLQPLLAMPASTMPDFLRGALIGLDGLRLIQSGDTQRGVARVDSGLRIVGGFQSPAFSSAVSLRLALHLASHPATREEGLKRLRYGFSDRLEMLPIIQYDLGKVYEAAGDRDRAVAAYGQFVRLWDHADSNFAPRIQDAKAALQRLNGEGVKR